MSTTVVRKPKVNGKAVQAPAKTELITKSVQQFMEDEGYISVVNVVRQNANGYLYITFMDADNVAENIYFSQAASELVEVDDEIANGFFSPFSMSYVTYTDGREPRWKISSANGGNRISVADLF